MEEQSARRAIFWRPDLVADAELRVEASRTLHREAGKRGFSCWPKRSHISGGYYCEVMKHEKTGRFYKDEHGHDWPEWRSIPNVAIGTAPGPLEAALVGLIQVVPNDDVWGCTVLLAELELLKRAVATAREAEKREAAMWAKLDWALIDLTNLLDDVNQPA